MEKMNMCRYFYDIEEDNVLVRASFEGEQVDAFGNSEPYYIHMTLFAEESDVNAAWIV